MLQFTLPEEKRCGVSEIRTGKKFLCRKVSTSRKEEAGLMGIVTKISRFDAGAIRVPNDAKFFCTDVLRCGLSRFRFENFGLC